MVPPGFRPPGAGPFQFRSWRSRRRETLPPARVARALRRRAPPGAYARRRGRSRATVHLMFASGPTGTGSRTQTGYATPSLERRGGTAAGARLREGTANVSGICGVSRVSAEKLVGRAGPCRPRGPADARCWKATRAWPRTKGMVQSSHRSASQYQRHALAALTPEERTQLDRPALWASKESLHAFRHGTPRPRSRRVLHVVPQPGKRCRHASLWRAAVRAGKRRAISAEPGGREHRLPGQPALGGVGHLQGDAQGGGQLQQVAR
jgi:hypothetical protein